MVSRIQHMLDGLFRVVLHCFYGWRVIFLSLWKILDDGNGRSCFSLAVSLSQGSVGKATSLDFNRGSTYVYTIILLWVLVMGLSLAR